MKARQGPPYAVDRPFELTLLAVDDGQMDDGDALPMPVPQLGEEGLAVSQTGDGLIQAPGARWAWPMSLSATASPRRSPSLLAAQRASWLTDSISGQFVRIRRNQYITSARRAAKRGMGIGPCTA